jgi:hypothetical protein
LKLENQGVCRRRGKGNDPAGQGGKGDAQEPWMEAIHGCVNVPSMYSTPHLALLSGMHGYIFNGWAMVSVC